METEISLRKRDATSITHHDSNFLVSKKERRDSIDFESKDMIEQVSTDSSSESVDVGTERLQRMSQAVKTIIEVVT